MREFVSILVLSAALIAAPSFAGPGKAKRNGPHPSASAFEHANENARFKRDDWSAAKRRADEDEKDKKAKKDKKHAADDQDTEKRPTRKADKQDSEKSKAKDAGASAAGDERKAGKRQTDGRTAAKR